MIVDSVYYHELSEKWPYRVRLTNITDHTVYCPAHVPILAWVPLGHLPQDVGYVRLDSVKFTEWQVLAYAETRDKDLYKKEEKLYEQWLATQPSAVARPEYTYPTSILQYEENETASDNNQHEDRGDAQRSTMEENADIWVANTGVTMRTPDSSCSEGSSDDSLELNFPEATPDPNYGSDFMILEKSFISVVKAITTKGYESAEDDVIYAPIKQRAHRIPIRYLQKLYELLKGLLKANLVSFSDSQWASPLVIVLKKNGEDIRLCIDYKMANAVTAIMEYAMPLVDDLLTGLDSYLWFCSSQRMLGHNDDS
ncbi:hypothetical protein PHMEG_00023022 [Phytophthora megakarya]|uniref:Reverse transcriptase n=1 Tax=Phytophthora megakarya TaxID=4795 RepID=A0A225VJ31_9STRA|nr:hypothetical protein PHMEG_00023022 [Phytophthora megakarya]